MLPLSELANDFADALYAVDAGRPQGRSRTRVYQHGVGPLSESEATESALKYLRQGSRSTTYAMAAECPYPNSRQICDVVIPGEWAIEVKLARPYGDNGREAEHWSENLLHPYPGTTSAIGDCIKLVESSFKERRAVLVFGYEHTPPRLPLEPAVMAFEVIASGVASLHLSHRAAAFRTGLIHPVHQQLAVFGWEVLGRKA